MAKIHDTVRKFIERLAPEPVCDECIAERLKLPAPSAANRQTRLLAGTDGFVREVAVCSLCGGPRKVIRKAR